MAIFDLYSKRKVAEDANAPDVYQYDRFENKLKVQIVHIITDAFGNEGYEEVQNNYQNVIDILCREYGVFYLLGDTWNQRASSQLKQYFLQEDSIEKSFDVVEICFRLIDRIIRTDNLYQSRFNVKISADDALDELNERFKENAFGFKLEDGFIIKVSNEYIHKEIIRPALNILRNPLFSGAQEEFLEAHNHYRKNEYKEAMNCCLKSFESTMKVVLHEMNITYDQNATSKVLISLLFSNEYIPKYLQSHFNGLQSVLESGVPTIRNKLSGHGQGIKVLSIEEKYVEYALNLTATNITFLGSGIK